MMWNVRYARQCTRWPHRGKPRRVQRTTQVRRVTMVAISATAFLTTPTPTKPASVQSVRTRAVGAARWRRALRCQPQSALCRRPCIVKQEWKGRSYARKNDRKPLLQASPAHLFARLPYNLQANELSSQSHHRTLPFYYPEYLYTPRNSTHPGAFQWPGATGPEGPRPAAAAHSHKASVLPALQPQLPCSNGVVVSPSNLPASLAVCRSRPTAGP